MAQPVWSKVRKELGHLPIVEGAVGGENPVYVERYLYQATDIAVSGLKVVGLVTQFGGARVKEGESDRWRNAVLPSQTMLIPAGVATHWHYGGTVDYAVFYFLDENKGIAGLLAALTRGRDAPLLFNDALVSAAAVQLATELQKGRTADEAFMAKLADVMLEQCYRLLTTPSTGGIHPRHVHFSRLQKVLNYIHENLTADMSAETLAKRADVSLAHFRRVFQEAMGMPPHRYVLSVRLEQARKLLTMTTTPISRIAQDCGFSSQSHLTASFRAAHAATPAEYRAQVTAGRGGNSGGH